MADVLKMAATHAKRDFLQAIPNPKQHPEFAGRQFQLLLKFEVAANTSAFTSVREIGESDAGGAHPLPIEAAFVFDRKAGKLIGLGDLFGKPDAARKTLAKFAHAALLKKLMANAPGPNDGSPKALHEWRENTLKMLDEGTQPTRANFSLFVVRAGTTEKSPSPGITLIFPPYQVAAYVYGTQTVEVPVKVFAKFLKPAYRDDFTSP